MAVTTINRRSVFGVNSRAPTYTSSDRASANRAVDVLIAKHPNQMNTRNIGGMPNNAVYHAEATLLLRAARANGGSLSGRHIVVHTDRTMCSSCKEVLPLLNRELGNPTVTFVSPTGVRRTIRNGNWID